MRILATLPLDEVLAHSLRTNNQFAVSGSKLCVKVSRLRQFAVHGCKCHYCGIEGNAVLITEDGGHGKHADVFHVKKNGKYVLMTRDHIRPASLKGDESIWNMRPMCAPCNHRRGNLYTEVDKEQWAFNQRWARKYNQMWNIRHKRTPFQSIIVKGICLIVPLSTRYKISKLVAKIT